MFNPTLIGIVLAVAFYFAVRAYADSIEQQIKILSVASVVSAIIAGLFIIQ